MNGVINLVDELKVELMSRRVATMPKASATRLGAIAAAAALVGASVAMGGGTASAAYAAAPSDASGLSHANRSEISALFSAGVQPQVEQTDDSEVQFVDAVVDDDYVEVGAVEESIGDAQQAEAVSAALEPDAPAGDIADVARIDLEADTAVIGVTWDLEATDPEGIYWRHLSDGTWQQWSSVDIDTNEAGPEARPGTEPIAISNAQAVEVVARTSDGRNVPGLTLHVVSAEKFGDSENALLETYPDGEEVRDNDGEPSDEQVQDAEGVGNKDDVLLDQSGAASAENSAFSLASEPEAASATAVGTSASLSADGTVYDTGYDGLKIGTRAGWGAPATSTWKPEAITIKGAIVHHTEGNNDYTQAQVPQQIRNVYHYQAVTRGWGDIGYNLVVDKYGGVWEGRYGGLTKAVKGAQAYGANSETFGITIMGSYLKAAPPTVARQAMSKAIAWKLNVHGIKSSSALIQVPGHWNLQAGNGKKISVPTVSGHRDVSPTDCPGDPFYAQMGTVRSEVQAHLDALGKTTPSGVGSPSTFSAGNVISDAAFYNADAMTEAEIKTFIETAGASCKPGSGTTCLKDSKFPTQSLTTLRGGCEPLSMSGNQAPWTIIHRTAHACGINPQVLLVMLQKEQSGLTQPRSDATWAKAMGSGCPDGSGCDPAQGGFMKQLYYGADKLVSYQLKSQAGHVDAFKAGKAVTIQHNSDTSCGSESVKFSNVATASLYEYTPYIGNSSKAGCGATGQKNFWSIMWRYFDGGATGAASSAAVVSKVAGTPISGSDRYDTNYQVNKANMTAGKPVFVVTGTDFPDALSIGPVSGMLNGTIVLASPSGIDSRLLALVKSRAPSAVYVVGGRGVVSDVVVQQIESATGKTAKRISGKDRYETSAAVFDVFFKDRSFGAPFIASGADYPDALAAAAAGGALKRPVVLVPGTSKSGSLPSSVAKTIKAKGVKSVVLVGGTGAISSTVASNVKAQGFSVERASGSNRYQTNTAVNDYVSKQGSGTAVEGLWVASGQGFADALSATAVAGSASQRLVLSNGNCLPSPSVSSWVNGTGSKITKISLVGGKGVLGGVYESVRECR